MLSVQRHDDETLSPGSHEWANGLSVRVTFLPGSLIVGPLHRVSKFDNGAGVLCWGRNGKHKSDVKMRDRARSEIAVQAEFFQMHHVVPDLRELDWWRSHMRFFARHSVCGWSLPGGFSDYIDWTSQRRDEYTKYRIIRNLVPHILLWRNSGSAHTSNDIPAGRVRKAVP